MLKESTINKPVTLDSKSGMRIFEEHPSSNRYDAATAPADLFSMFTANIIREKTVFIR